jgi:hypothetical protein
VLKNEGGTFSSYECQRTASWLEVSVSQFLYHFGYILISISMWYVRHQA